MSQHFSYSPQAAFYCVFYATGFILNNYGLWYFVTTPFCFWPPTLVVVLTLPCINSE